jgi:chromosome segregation ATPase
MMNDVKEQKVLKMKAIKKLSIEKDSLVKAQKALIAERDDIKSKQESYQREFMLYQQQYDQFSANSSDEEALVKANQASESMAALLETIEKQRERFSAVKTQLKLYKERLFEIDTDLTEERAELVATSGLLEQNEQIRAKIQEEEQAKAKALLDAAIEAEREKLRQESLGDRSEVERRHAEELSALREALAQVRSDLDGALQRVASMEQANQSLTAYAESLVIENKLLFLLIV